MQINGENKSYISFEKRLKGHEYHRDYGANENYNGQAPDTFILKRVKNQFTNPDGTTIIDLGAGQGRNSIPLAKKGYNLHAYEINNIGRSHIRKKAMMVELSDKIKIFNSNILDNLKIEGKRDFAFMSHISQHFNVDELKQVFQNVSETLNTGGEFVFDALVRKRQSYQHYDTVPSYFRKQNVKSLEDVGAASFKESDIIKAAKEAGFKLIRKSKFNEKGQGRANYEYQNLWGCFNRGNIKKGIKRKPVKLTWFIFRK